MTVLEFLRSGQDEKNTGVTNRENQKRTYQMANEGERIVILRIGEDES